MAKSKLDDDFHSYLVKDVSLTEKEKFPILMDLDNVEIPKGLIPFEKAKKCNVDSNKSMYIHFYQHDKTFSDILTSTKKYLKLLQSFDGVITPDCSLLIGQTPCLQKTNVYFNLAVGCYLQKNGIPVILNVRWSDESSFEFCFLGIPRNYIVSISTHGCIRSKKEKDMFKAGLDKMLKTLEPRAILVHGYMPPYIFDEYLEKYKFYRYPSQFEKTHKMEEK